jgi:hypothetical protein
MRRDPQFGDRCSTFPEGGSWDEGHRVISKIRDVIPDAHSAGGNPNSCTSMPGAAHE